ncbi:MAG: polyketide cyclase, partial [Nitrospina sp.]|nr:polyketide cyclase [Nitrospina sp.]
MTDSYELIREITIQAKPEIVFSYLTEQGKMKEWFGEVVEADAKP